MTASPVSGSPVGSPCSSPSGSPRGKSEKEDLMSGGYLLRIPPVRPSGNELEDQERESSFSLLANMVVTLVQQPNHIGPLKMALQKRLSIQNRQVEAAEDATFMPIHSLSNLHSLDAP